PLYLHSGERLELGNVLLEHVDERMLGQEKEELLALEALPVESLGARRREDERPGGGDRGLEERPTREPASRHRRSPLMLLRVARQCRRPSRVVSWTPRRRMDRCLESGYGLGGAVARVA